MIKIIVEQYARGGGGGGAVAEQVEKPSTVSVLIALYIVHAGIVLTVPMILLLRYIITPMLIGDWMIGLEYCGIGSSW